MDRTDPLVEARGMALATWTIQKAALIEYALLQSDPRAFLRRTFDRASDQFDQWPAGPAANAGRAALQNLFAGIEVELQALEASRPEG